MDEKMSITYDLQKEKMGFPKEEYLEDGQKKGYFVLDESKIKYRASGKKYNFNDPEEKVRAEYYFDLIEKYRYPANRIELEIEMPDRTPERYADVVVYRDDEKRIPYILVECKKDGISDAEFEQATKQADYLFSFVRSNLFVSLIGKFMSGTTYPTVSVEDILSIKIPLPPIEIQNKISAEVRKRISEVERLKKEAGEIVEKAKREVERIILGK